MSVWLVRVGNSWDLTFFPVTVQAKQFVNIIINVPRDRIGGIFCREKFCKFE